MTETGPKLLLSSNHKLVQLYCFSHMNAYSLRSARSQIIRPKAGRYAPGSFFSSSDGVRRTIRPLIGTTSN